MRERIGVVQAMEGSCSDPFFQGKRKSAFFFLTIHYSWGKPIDSAYFS